jgi:prepilin-type N-terminal cleavage/methylation domain-containing protein
VKTRPTPGRIRQARAPGFTLIELMVALALAAVISVMIMMVSTSMQESYSQTVQRVEVYNRFRLAIDRIRDDIANWIPSQELEFYVDGRGAQSRRNFHYDPGEEIPDEKDEHGPGVVDGGTIGHTNAQANYDEFASILERHYTSVEPSQLAEGNLDKKVHDAYQLYFRTMTHVGGHVREANVEYMLVDPKADRKRWRNGVPPPPRDVAPEDVRDLALYKVVRYFRIDEQILTNLTKYPVQREIIEVATNVTDFRVEYMAANPFSRARGRGSPRFVTPEEDYENPAENATRPERVTEADLGPLRAYRKSFGYGSVRLDKKFDLAVATPARGGDQGLKNVGGTFEPVRVGFRSNPNISFAELVPGDRIFIFRGNERGQVTSGANVTGRLAAFPAGTYTVKANINGMLEVVEDIDSSTWNNRDQTGVYYKAAYLPAAVRVTVRMVDDQGLNPKTMQQVIWLRRRAR